jgi:hypothetical protein
MRFVRADFDRDTIVVYQAYPLRIADPALRAGRFVAPSSFRRMTWIKPSFLWLMTRSTWGEKPDQERILAVRISRVGWERALSLGVLTAHEPRFHRSIADWDSDFKAAKVHVQWDPERTLGGVRAQEGSIQVGLSRHVIEEFVRDWIVGLEDVTPLAKKIRSLRDQGNRRAARRLLPAERRFPVPEGLHRRLGMG